MITDRVVTWGAGIVAVLCLALSVDQCSGRVKAEHRADKAEKQVAAVKADLTTCRANTSTLKSSLDGQNRAVEAMRAEGEARVAESRKAVSAARSVAESYRREAGRVLAVKAGPDVCRSADDLILSAVR